MMKGFGGAYRGRRVLVTGHTGFKGSWLTEWLLRLGAEVTGLSIDVPTTPSHFELCGLGAKVETHWVDVRNAASVRDALAAANPEIVFHLAAQPIVRRGYDEPHLTFETNCGGTLNVLEAIRLARSVKAAVFVTSDKCYENVEWEFGYRETDRLGGGDPYSASKACAEITAQAYSRSFFSEPGTPAIATARAGNVIGGGDWAANRIVPDSIRAWSAGAEVSVRRPEATRPWQHVLEPVSGYLLLGAQLLSGVPGIRGQAFNFGPASNSGESVRALLSHVSAVWHDARWNETPTRDGKHESGLLQLNCDRAYQVLKWRGVLSFSEAADMTATWYLQQHQGVASEKLTDSDLLRYCDLARSRGLQWAT